MVVPGMVASVWVWPRLRVPQLWFGLCLLTLISTATWLAVDLHNFVEFRETSEKAAVRILYKLLGARDLPVVPVVLGSFVTGLISRHCLRKACSGSTKEPTSPGVIGEVG